eukprot:CAMPEP_0116111728 /NCGR_PEP_ID=MMETSP0327-20121206/18601_1 /TAXON_ID=44447 /ORGANISM="Pseudo-nitzschia delicatissima, Strain B596" /LENGTH=191 /DNA_ID=CAMNT_0003604981 /DNA_START=248 /DNA_END=823 /DNA_ORIENTATION=-
MSMNKSSNMQSMQVAYGDEITAGASNTHVNCFGFCCDFRKAVIAVNGTMLGFQILMMILIAVGGSVLGSSMSDAVAELDDDQAKQAMSDFSSGGGAIVGFLEVLVFIGVIFTLLGIFGALKFNKCAVITTSVFYSLSVLGNLLSFNSSAAGQSIFNIILPALFLYPHVCFLILMDKGIMTAENYHRIEKCC